MAQKMIRLLMEESGKKKKKPPAAASQAGKAQSKSTSQQKQQTSAAAAQAGKAQSKSTSQQKQQTSAAASQAGKTQSKSTSQSKKQALVEAKLAATVKTKPSWENLVAKHGQNASLMLYDLDAGKKEIQTLENAIRQRQRDASLARTRSAAQNTYLGAPVKQNFDFVQNLAETKALQQELTQKRTAYNQAKLFQKAAAYEDTLRHDDFDRFDDYIPSDDPLHNWINDPAYRESYEESFQSVPNPNARKSRYARKGYDRMNESEIAIYNYYYEKEGKDAAGKYLDSIQETLNGRIAEDLYGRVQGNTGQELLFGVTAGFNQAGSGLMNFFNTDDDYIARTPYEIASESVREDLADDGGKLPDWLGGASAGQVAYDTIGVAANMAPSMLVSAATGVPMAGNAVMGISAAGNAYKQALNEGFDKGQARGYGILVGASEVVLEKCLGGISAYGGNKLGKAALENLSNVDEALKMVAKTLGGGVSEFREEYLQEILDPVFRHITLKTDEELNLLSPDALYAGFLGALLGSGIESVDAAVKGLPVDFDDIGFAAEPSGASSENAEFAEIFEGLEGLEGWERLKSLPEAEQERFIESLFEEDIGTVEEAVMPEAEISKAEADLAVEESAERGIIKERDSAKGIGIQYFANKGLDKQSDRELQKSIRSWNVIVEKHKDKVNNPAKYDKDWEFKDERAKAGLVKHWEKEIRAVEKNIKEANELIAKRKEENK